MPKKFSETDKRKWLELYEGGKTELWIAREHAKCDPRTVKNGINEARRKHDANIARIELIKEALRKHQDDLLEELSKIMSDLPLPPVDFAVLSWQQKGDSIFKEIEIVKGKQQRDVASKAGTASSIQSSAKRQLLREHLRNDRLWKMLAQREKTYGTHLTARIALQCKTVYLLEEKTGCKLVDSKDIPPPFLYSYSTGDSFFKAILRRAFGIHDSSDLESEMFTDTTAGTVRYHSLILAEVPGNEEACKKHMLDAYKELQLSSEVVQVVETYKELEESIMKARQVVEEKLLLGLILGQCKICRLLGM